MTPEEKANNLVDVFRVILMSEDTDCGNEILCTTIAIKHAEICVNEVMEHAGMETYQYFAKVKHELSLM